MIACKSSKSKYVMWHTSSMTTRRGPQPQKSEIERLQEDVAVHVAAGANESVQRVITAVHGLSRRLNQGYGRQLADLDLTAGDWAVMTKLVRDGGDDGLTPSVLADAANVAPSSMTHRLDRPGAAGAAGAGTD